MKTYRIRLKPHCQRATDVERNYFTHATKGAGSEPLICALDLREPCSSQSLIDRTLDRFGRIDALLNIAGAVPQIDLFEMTDQQWEDGAALKLHGSRRLTIRAWEREKESKRAYGILTEAACCTRYAWRACGESCSSCCMAGGAAFRMSSPPIFGAIVAPNELKACVKSSRLDAVPGFPSKST